MLRPVAVLAATQLIGWGTVGLLAILGRPIAEELHMSLAAVFAGNSVLYVVMGLWAPVLSRGFARFGARRVMLAGSAVAVAGFLLLAAAHGPARYFLAWAILGTAGSATLTTAAFILLNELAGPRARSAIGALMLVTGLSSSLFWPATSLLFHSLGWRATCLVYAAAIACISLPLIAFALPRAAAPGTAAAAAPRAPSPGAPRGVFRLIVAAIALNAFVTYGFSAILIELFKSEGLTPVEAVGFGSLLGVIQVSARGLDLLGGGRWDGITTGLIAGLALPAALLLLALGGGAWWSVAGFVALYGLASGALAVARATIPLVFYDKAAYARAASHIALPLNLISAAAPPVLASLLTRFGAGAALALAALCSSSALVLLLRLSRLRPAISPETPAAASP